MTATPLEGARVQASLVLNDEITNRMRVIQGMAKTLENYARVVASGDLAEPNDFVHWARVIGQDAAQMRSYADELDGWVKADFAVWRVFDRWVEG